MITALTIIVKMELSVKMEIILTNASVKKGGLEVIVALVSKV